jgi:isopenicillin N synthase-like dioxygenase
MRSAVLQYMQEMKRLGRLLMKTIACSLNVQDNNFFAQFDFPTELFRIFNYPPHHDRFPADSMGVGVHSDYGYLTILKQDDSGGLQVRSLYDADVWIDAPPVDGTFVINLGDALEHATKGLFRATPHRVLQRVNATQGRISMPYFFDPSFDSEMVSVVLQEEASQAQHQERIASRWDKLDPLAFKGSYGQYLLNKVSKAFPKLFAEYVALDTTEL